MNKISNALNKLISLVHFLIVRIKKHSGRSDRDRIFIDKKTVRPECFAYWGPNIVLGQKQNVRGIFLFSPIFLFLNITHINPAATAAIVETTPVALEIKAQHNSAMRLLIGVMDNSLSDIASVIKKDLEFLGQFNVTLLPVQTIHSKQEMQKLFVDGYAIALFLQPATDSQHIDWRLYDTSQAIMLKGKRYTKRGTVERGWAHNIADDMMLDLTGNQGFFSTKIAYCKDAKMGKTVFKHIYIADYDGNYPELLVAIPTINVAPRWNRDINNPLLFYSEATNQNMRLMAVNLRKQRRIASNFDGLNMLPAFSHDGKKVVFCASRGLGSCQLYFYEKGVFKQLTHNNGNNVSPTLTDSGDVMYFCSDAHQGQPHIYRYEMATQKLEQITNSGYCGSPSYCDISQKLAYTKIVNGTAQIFTYDHAAQKHSQITKDAGHKDECSWSPCGNYILYSIEQGKTRRLALLNIHNSQQKFLTTALDACSYPTWSPRYEQFPVVSG